MDNEQYLTLLLGQIILTTGPVLIETEVAENELPDDARAVMVEKTQEGYLVFLSDKEFVDESE